MTDAVEDDPVRRVTQAKVLEALGKFQPGVSDLERIYMASGIDPIYGPDVDYNLDYQLLAGQPYANYLTTTGTPIGGTGGGTRDGGISTLPRYTYPYNPDAEDFELDIINLPETTVDTRISPTQGGSDPADFYSPYTLYGEGALDFDFKKGEPIDWKNSRIGKLFKKEYDKAKEKGIDLSLSGQIDKITKTDSKDLPLIGGLISMGDRGIAALRNLIPFGKQKTSAPEDYSPIYPEMSDTKTDMGGYAGGYQQPPDIMNDPFFTGDLSLDDLSDPSNLLKRLDRAMKEQGIETQNRIDALGRVKEKWEEARKQSGQEDERTTEQMVEDALAVDFSDYLPSIEERVTKAIESRQKGGGLGIGGYRYGAMDAPDSAFKVTTPHSDRIYRTYDDKGNPSGFRVSAENIGSRGFGGIKSRMLPRAGKGFGGRNPFAGEAPLPGSPDYAEYLIDSMGFDPKKFQREIERAVARDIPFVQMDDGQGNSYLIDKKTQAVIFGPFPTGDNSVSSIPRIGSMSEGGLAAFAKGDLVENFPRKNGQISGPGTEKSDDIPAMLSDGEFVTNAAALRGIGRMAGASANDRAEQRRLGAREMYKLQRRGMKAAGVV